MEKSKQYQPYPLYYTKTILILLTVLFSLLFRFDFIALMFNVGYWGMCVRNFMVLSTGLYMPKIRNTENFTEGKQFVFGRKEDVKQEFRNMHAQHTLSASIYIFIAVKKAFFSLEWSVTVTFIQLLSYSAHFDGECDFQHINGYFMSLFHYMLRC